MIQDQTLCNSKNNDQIWYKNQVSRNEIEKTNQLNKWFKTKYFAIKRMRI